ncbi:MAG: glycerophosphodiester phosphodiesterase [Acidimicrobiales bacterium]
MPTPRWPFLDWPHPIALAHRGGAGAWPENTMPAFENAVALGYRYVETDVHTTADGVLVAFHDDVLDRVTDRKGAISALPWSEVRRARVQPPAAGATSSSSGGGDGPDAPIPRLEELLGTWPELRINIDPKHDRAVDPLVEVLERTVSHDRVCIGAFSDRRLARVRRLTANRVCTSLGPAGIARLRLACTGAPVGRFVAGCAQVPARTGGRTLVDAAFLRTAHLRGLPVHVWTIDDPAEMRRLLDLGVDGLMTDHPAVLKQVLVERHAWD